jgi:enoyl-CoA hydratase
MGKYIEQERKGAIAIVTINRPEAMNALDNNVLQELYDTFMGLDEDRTVKVVILTGVKKAFVAGADIAAMSKYTPAEAEVFSAFGHKVFDMIENVRPVTIAAVNGFALGGGCELAMSCDIRVASEKAKMAIPETSLGIFPGFAGTQRLPRLVGLGIAKEMLATASMIDAARAYETGLVNHVVPAEELMTFCENLAQKVVKNSTSAIAAGKRLMTEGFDMPFEKAEELEAAYFGILFAGHDQREGMAAFLEKRAPEFD